MFQHFFLFELKYRLQRPMIYLFVLANFLMAFAATVSDKIVIGGSNDAVDLNAPYVIMNTTLLMTLVGIFMTTAIVNTTILRDYNFGFSALLYATPVKKSAYLLGKYFGALLISLLPFFGVFAGIALGASSSWVATDEVAPFSILPFWHTFVSAVFPNVLLVSAIVFLLAATFRSTVVSFLGAIMLLVLYVILLSFAKDLDSETVAILADPLAINAHGILTKYWTIEEKNTQLLSLSGLFLVNRLFWMGISLICLVAAYVKFSFTEKRHKSHAAKTDGTPVVSPHTVFTTLQALPLVQIKENASLHGQQYLNQVKMEFLSVIKSLPFLVLLLIGLFNMFGSLVHVSEIRGTGNYPVTYLIIEAIRNSLFLFLIVILMFYSGVLVWKERDYQFNDIYDAVPLPVWLPFSSKLTALMGILILVLCLAIGCGMIVQAAQGYFNFQLGIYLREFLVYDLAWLFTLAVLAMLVQTLSSNKYVGYVAFILLMITFQFGPSALSIKSNLLTYGAVPTYIFSDMNGWAPFEQSLIWFYSYWVLAAGFLGLIAILFWRRGQSLTLQHRFQIAQLRFKGNIAFLTLTLLILWLGTGSFLWYQTKVVNDIEEEEAVELGQVHYEKQYHQYEHLAQPRITAIDYQIDMFPQKRKVDVLADMVAKNKTTVPIQQLHFTAVNDFDLTIRVPQATLRVKDSIAKYFIYDLATPLLPNESLPLQVEVHYAAEGIENEVSRKDIVPNGTFLSNSKLLPVIGYTRSVTLRDAKKRANHRLPKRKGVEVLHANCSETCKNSYLSSDSDWVNVSATISTSKGQTAIAPGTLTKNWQVDDRNYFQYELEQPVVNFYSFISGNYEIAKEQWTSPSGKKVDLEVYYHRGHEYNIDKMLASLRHSLTYYTQHFTPYPHQQARIIEFPRYATFAQAFPGTMPYSEGYGFIANLAEEDAIDMVYYVVAHEMAHQWWAHQVIGANVQGATMLSETFAQYGALMVMKERYGQDKMKQFMRYEMDRYLRGRSRETDRELPLMYNENQGYIHYRKGSVVMYALQDYLGEEVVNAALRSFAEDMAYQEAPYTNTLEFMDYLTVVTPDSLTYLLTDMFENITLYSNKTKAAYVKTLSNGQYEVTLDVTVEKFRADSLGNETLIPHNDFIDIGVYSSEKNKGEKYGRPILVERHQISTRDTTFSFVVDEQPHKAGIDPNYLLVDRFPEDNLKVLTETED
ncbi:MAG: M1 family aminopeptidase [Bacteroidota bacterium]